MAYQVATSPGLIGGGSGPFIPPESDGAPQRRPIPAPGFQLPQGGRAGMSDLLAGGGIDGLLERLQGQLGGPTPSVDTTGLQDRFGSLTPSVDTTDFRDRTGGPLAQREDGGAMPAPASGADGRMKSMSMPFKPAPAAPPAAPPAAAPPAAPATAPIAAAASLATKPAKQPLPGSNADFAALATPPGRPKPMPQVTMPAPPAPDPWGDLAGTNFAKRAQSQGFADLAGYEKFREKRGGGGILGQMYDKATAGAETVAPVTGGARLATKPAKLPLPDMVARPLPPAPAPVVTKPMERLPAPPSGLNVLTTKPAANPGGGKDPAAAALFQGSPAGQNFLKRLQSLGVADVNEGVQLAKQRPDSVLGRMYANATQGMRIVPY